MLLRANLFFVRNLSASPALSNSKTVKNWIDGAAVESKTTKWINLTNPVFFFFLQLKKKFFIGH